MLANTYRFAGYKRDLANPTLGWNDALDLWGPSMTSEFSISLILPAYNEFKRIAQTIREAKAYFEQRQYPYEIIIAADGDDGTRELVAGMARQDATLNVIGCVERRGKGYGIRQGVALATGEIIGFADADNKTPIDEFDKCVPWLRDGYEIVIG
jgi:dolichyl-phosphate beta-glucosyltransferase